LRIYLRDVGEDLVWKQYWWYGVNC